MSLVQNIVRAVTSEKTFREMEEESLRWKLTCKECGFQTSIWEQGGIRYKASSIKKAMPGRCPQCGTKQLFPVEEEESRQPLS